MASKSAQRINPLSLTERSNIGSISHNLLTQKNNPISPPSFINHQNFLPTFLLTLATAFTVLTFNPLPSHASFGTSGASVVSFPNVKPLSVEEFLRLSDAKQKQREFAVSCSPTQGANCRNNVNRLVEEFAKYDKAYENLESKTLEDLEEIQKNYEIRVKTEKQLKELEQKLNKLLEQPAYVSYVCSAVASIASTLVMHPLDTLKTRIISRKDDSEGGAFASVLNNPLSLYQGLVPNVVKEAPASALYLGVYESCRKILFLTKSVGGNPLLVYLISGAAGEFVGSLLRAPAEAIKVRVQTSENGTLQSAVQDALFTELGLLSMLQSWGASVTRDVPMGAVQLAIFEGLKTYVINEPTLDFDVSSLLAEALFGLIGGVVGAIITTPPDVVTTLVITSNEESGGMGGKSLVEVAAQVWEEEGWKGFIKGWQGRALYWGPAIAIFLSVYCTLRQYALQNLGL